MISNKSFLEGECEFLPLKICIKVKKFGNTETKFSEGNKKKWDRSCFADTN